MTNSLSPLMMLMILGQPSSLPDYATTMQKDCETEALTVMYNQWCNHPFIHTISFTYLLRTLHYYSTYATLLHIVFLAEINT